MVTCEQTFRPNRLGFDRVFPSNLYYKSVEWEKNPNFFFSIFMLSLFKEQDNKN